jgi:hypothetical protein
LPSKPARRHTQIALLLQLQVELDSGLVSQLFEFTELSIVTTHKGTAKFLEIGVSRTW